MKKMKKMKKILVSALSALTIAASGAGIVALSTTANAETTPTTLPNGWTQNTTSTSISGQSYLGTSMALSSDVTTLPGVYSVSSLASGFMFQVMPDETDVVVADHVQVTFRDAVDETNLISVWLEISTTNGVFGNWGYAALSDSLTSDDAGWLKYTGTTQGVASHEKDYKYMGYWAADAKNEMGGDNSHNTKYNFFGAESGKNTTAIKISYSGQQVLINGRNIASLTHTNYLTWNSEKLDTTDAAQKALKDKYTTDYVNGLFSSGFVTVEFSFGAERSVAKDNAYEGKVNLIKMGDESLATLSPDRFYNSDYVNDYESTSRSGSKYTGTTIPITSAGTTTWNTISTYYSNLISLPDSYTTTDVDGGFLFQILTDDNQFAASDMFVTFRDATDSSKMVHVILSQGNWYGGDRTMLHVATNPNVCRKDNSSFYLNAITDNATSQPVHFNRFLVNELGTTDYSGNERYTVFAANGTDATQTTAVKIAIKSDGIYVNGARISDLVNASLFSSGNVKISTQFFAFNGTHLATLHGKVNLISVGAKSLAKLADPAAPKTNTVTTVVGSTSTTKTYMQGKKVALSAPTVGSNEVFVGWKIGESVYPADYSFTLNSNVTAEAVTIGFEMRKGASIRINDSNDLGVRWAGRISVADKAKLDGLSAQWGVKVTETDVDGYLDIIVDKWVSSGDEFYGVMTGLTTDDVNRSFTGQAYVYVTYANGAKATIWAKPFDNTQTIYQVAKAYYDDEDTTSDERALLEYLIGSLSGES